MFLCNQDSFAHLFIVQFKCVNRMQSTQVRIKYIIIIIILFFTPFFLICFASFVGMLCSNSNTLLALLFIHFISWLNVTEGAKI